MKPKAVLRDTVESEEEIRLRMTDRLSKEMEKFQRDVKCGGVQGNHYVALNYRIKY